MGEKGCPTPSKAHQKWYIRAEVPAGRCTLFSQITLFLIGPRADDIRVLSSGAQLRYHVLHENVVAGSEGSYDAIGRVTVLVLCLP